MRSMELPAIALIAAQSASVCLLVIGHVLMRRTCLTRRRLVRFREMVCVEGADELPSKPPTQRDVAAWGTGQLDAGLVFAAALALLALGRYA